MAQPVYSVGIINPYATVNPYIAYMGAGPRRNVFYDPRVVEYPALPQENKKSNTGKKLLGLLAAAALAFVFRGKIKAGAGKLLEKAQPFVQKVYAKSENFLKKVADFAKPYIIKGADLLGKGIQKVRPYAEKLVEAIQRFGEKVAKYVKPAV